MASFYPDARLELIQAVRAVHALMDTDHEVCIPPQHADKFAVLRERFGARYTVTTKPAPSVAIGIDHQEPSTRVGAVRRPLIFSPAILSHCRGLWQPRRSIPFSFAGLVTRSRHEALSGWMRRSFPGVAMPLPAVDESRAGRLWARVRRKLGGRPAPRSTRHDAGEVVFWSSTRGRHFPGKSWDDEYFQLLAASRFVLCPNGDFVWSYRFFEAAMCGAIPIVQESCPAYDGFRFRTMDETAGSMEWSPEDADHNYHLALERLVVPTQELSDQIEQEARS